MKILNNSKFFFFSDIFINFNKPKISLSPFNLEETLRNFLMENKIFRIIAVNG